MVDSFQKLGELLLLLLHLAIQNDDFVSESRVPLSRMAHCRTLRALLRKCGFNSSSRSRALFELVVTNLAQLTNMELLRLHLQMVNFLNQSDIFLQNALVLLLMVLRIVAQLVSQTLNAVFQMSAFNRKLIAQIRAT